MARAVGKEWIVVGASQDEVRVTQVLNHAIKAKKLVLARAYNTAFDNGAIIGSEILNADLCGSLSGFSIHHEIRPMNRGERGAQLIQGQWHIQNGRILTGACSAELKQISVGKNLGRSELSLARE